jgi:DNA-binding transcriptional LysR family regulator
MVMPMQLSERIGRRMKLQDLHVLMTVVQAGSMGQAAARLNTSQPAVSRSIAELEHALGVRLLDRHRQGVEPTGYGRALLECGMAVFDDLRQGVKKIEFLADPTAGEVRFGCGTLLAGSFVSAVIDRLSRRHPRIVFHLLSGYPDMLHRQLRERSVEFLIVRKWGSVPDERFDYQALFEAGYVVAAGARSPWTRRRRIDLAELVKEPWVLPTQESGIWSVATEAFRANGLDQPRTVLFTLSDARMSLLATGRFLTILPAYTFRFAGRPRDIKVLPVELSVAGKPVGIVTLKNRTLSPVAQLFIDCARELAKPVGKRK